MKWLALALVMALATGLRFFRLDAQSLWYDEGISAYQVQRTFLEIAQAAAGDTHPPLYYWTLKAWASVFGNSEWGLRSLSAVCGVAVVALTWLLGQRLLGFWPAIGGALLLAVSPLAVYYSQEVRMYTMECALGLLAMYAAVRWWRSGATGWSWSLAVYVLAAAASLYTQYLAALLLAAANLAIGGTLLVGPTRRVAPRSSVARGLVPRPGLGGPGGPPMPTGQRPVPPEEAGDKPLRYGLVTLRRMLQPRLITWLLAQAAVALLFLPWLPVFLEQLSHRSLNTSPRTLSNLLIQTVQAVTLGPNAEVSWSRPSVVALLSLALLGLWAVRRWPADAAVVGLLAAVPALGVIGMGVRSGLFELRYLTLALPGLALLAGLGAAQLGQSRPRPVFSAIAALALGLILAPTSTALARGYFDETTFRDDYRGVALHIRERLQPGDAVMLNAGNQWDVFSFYYSEDAPVYRLPARRPIDVEDTRTRLEDIRGQHRRLWTVLWASREGDPTGFIEDWLARNAFQSSHRWYQSVQLLLFSFARPGGEPDQRLDAVLANGARLLGYTLATDQLQPSDTLGLTLFWRAESTIGEPFKIFAHLLDRDRRVVAQRDNEPVGALRPTTTWAVGEVIADNYGILLPNDLPSGNYVLEVGMYRPTDGQRPLISDSFGRALGDHLLLAEVQVR